MAFSAAQPVIWLSARLKTWMRSSASRIITPSALRSMIALSWPFSALTCSYNWALRTAIAA